MEPRGELVIKTAAQPQLNLTHRNLNDQLVTLALRQRKEYVGNIKMKMLSSTFSPFLLYKRYGMKPKCPRHMKEHISTTHN